MPVNRMKVVCIIVNASIKIAFTKISTLILKDKSPTPIKFVATFFRALIGEDSPSDRNSLGKLSGKYLRAKTKEVAERRLAKAQGNR